MTYRRFRFHAPNPRYRKIEILDPYRNDARSAANPSSLANASDRLRNGSEILRPLPQSERVTPQRQRQPEHECRSSRLACVPNRPHRESI
ncbi:MAG: hypothetical protein ABS79_01995 [Planctomycetes bacterium SCN 63-9]|nr:MAG: hypothetical protein ABS79_01995 [Planctomycetes bacterium SCN 63-9]